MRKISIATRGSRLAIWQAEYVKKRIKKRYPDLDLELIIIKTKGDVILDVPLAKIGGKALFVKEIEDVLLDGKADIAVHSLKDVPMTLPGGLILGVVPERGSSADLLLSENYNGLEALPKGARVGTSSLRRTAQLLALRPDLNIQNLRGNIDTRLRKLNEGNFDAIVMAEAGLKRLGLTAPFQDNLSAQEFLPAPGQGALGLEYMETRQDLAQMLSFLEHIPTRLCIDAERAFLAKLGGSCQTPVGALARFKANGLLTLEGMVADLSGKTVIRQSLSCIPNDNEQAARLGIDLAVHIMEDGGEQILAELARDCCKED